MASKSRPTRTNGQLDREVEASFPASDPPSNSPMTGMGAPKSHKLARRKEPAIGFALSSEENSPQALVKLAQHAEGIGLDFCSISDHFHPWVPKQGNSPFVWSVLGAIGMTTERINIMTGVTCPILRMHPAIVAHAAATAAVMLDGRFYFGLGTGEALNELVTGERWPSGRERLARLREAIDIMRELMSGETVNVDGEYYTVTEAKLFTHPETPPPILVASASPASARMAGEQDGLIMTTPEKELVKEFEGAGGKNKPRFGQVTLCWDRSENEARKIAHEWWPTTVLGWDVRSWVNTPQMFEDITKTATEEDIAKNLPCGPNLDPVIKQFRSFMDAGFDHIYFHQVGPKQDEFLEMMKKELLPELKGARSKAA